jgi:hypothetical protein
VELLDIAEHFGFDAEYFGGRVALGFVANSQIDESRRVLQVVVEPSVEMGGIDAAAPLSSDKRLLENVFPLEMALPLRAFLNGGADGSKILPRHERAA